VIYLVVEVGLVVVVVFIISVVLTDGNGQWQPPIPQDPQEQPHAPHLHDSSQVQIRLPHAQLHSELGPRAVTVVGFATTSGVVRVASGKVVVVACWEVVETDGKGQWQPPMPQEPQEQPHSPHLQDSSQVHVKLPHVQLHSDEVASVVAVVIVVTTVCSKVVDIG